MVELLRFESNDSLPQSVADDLQLSKILPSSAQKILLRPCGASNLPPRFELFSLMDAELKCRLSEFLSELRAHSRALERFRDAKNVLEKLCLRIALHEGYLKIMQSIAALDGKGELLSELAAYYNSKLPSELADDLVRVRRLLERINRFFYLNSDKVWITPPSSEPTFTERFLSLASSLSLPAEPPKEHFFSLPASVCDSLFLLFTVEFAEIRSILDKYFMLDLREATAHIHELEFLLAISDILDRAALPHCIPEISSAPEFVADELYDISLMAKKSDIVPNDAEFTCTDRFFFLTGANGGGKTTYARALGINLLLFLSGCPVFAKSARIYPFSALLTHFPADERFTDSGRLDDERRRSDRMLAAAGDSPFLIYNETFSGTDEERGYSLLCSLADTLRTRGCFGILVTHFHRVSELGLPMLSVEIDTENDNARTYRIRRVSFSRSSFAADILKKYRLDKRSLAQREAHE